MSKTKIGEEQMPDEYYDLERRTEIKATSNRLKKQFLTWRECEIVYSLQHRKLLKLADEAGAIYRFDGVVLINREIFEASVSMIRMEMLWNIFANNFDQLQFTELNTTTEYRKTDR